MHQQLKEAAPAKTLDHSGRIDSHQFEPPARLKHASPRALFKFHHCSSQCQCPECRGGCESPAPSNLAEECNKEPPLQLSFSLDLRNRLIIVFPSRSGI